MQRTESWSSLELISSLCGGFVSGRQTRQSLTHRGLVTVIVIGETWQIESLTFERPIVVCMEEECVRRKGVGHRGKQAADPPSDVARLHDAGFAHGRVGSKTLEAVLRTRSFYPPSQPCSSSQPLLRHGDL
jgi:hypothetical protein